MYLWESPGRDNTERTVNISVEKALEYDIKDIVVASNRGVTVEKLLEQKGADKLNITCITHHVGFKEPGCDEMERAVRDKLINAGVNVYTGTHVLAGVDRAIRLQFGGIYPPELIANTLRMFGQGIKVCVEIGIMALDAGLVEYEQKVIAVGGTGRGADASCVLKPGHSNNVFETRVLEILCRPKPV